MAKQWAPQGLSNYRPPSQFICDPDPQSTTQQMKCGKAVRHSGIIADMLKAAGEEGVELVRQMVEAVFSSGMIPVDKEESVIMNLCKGKGEWSHWPG